MDADERQRAIIDRVERDGTVKVNDLAEMLGVAAVTVRVDVRELARRGLVSRVHGGVSRARARAETSAETDAATSSGPLPTLGMVVPHSAYYYPKVVAGARETADRLGARLVLGVSQNDADEERALVGRLLRSGIHGLAIATTLDPSTSPDTESWLAGIDVPTVLVERRSGRGTRLVEHVATEHEFGAHDAVRHLWEVGRRRIGLLHFATITAPRLRQGFDEALGAFGLDDVSADVPRNLTDDSAATLDAAADDVARAVRSGALDALIVHNDVAALPLLSRLQQAGVGVPSDLALVTYDDELAPLADPPLTAVAPPREAVGEQAVRMLLDRLRDPSQPPRQLLLRPELRVRSSCGGEGGAIRAS